VDQASVSGHNAVDRGQAETCAASRLGREKGLEQVRARGVIHTLAVIGHDKKSTTDGLRGS